MTTLFPLAMRGLGTVEVESLSSYLIRLAIAHSVSIWKLLEHAESIFIAKHGQSPLNLKYIRAYGDTSTFVRPTETTRQIVDVLADVTRQTHLRCGTFLALELALDRSTGVFEKETRWCPACMAEFELAEDSGYFKLIWQLTAVTHCPTHGVGLIASCPMCGSSQGGFRARKSCVRCTKCDASLSMRRNQEDIKNSWDLEGADLLELVEVVASDAKLAFPSQGVRAMLSTVFDEVWAREDDLKFWKLVPRHECVGIVTGDQPVTLTTVRRLAYRLGMQVSELLAGKVDATSGLLDVEWTQVLPKDMRPRKRHKSYQRAELHHRLNTALRENNNGSAPSLKEVARKTGTTVGCLRYHFPEQARQIIDHYLSWREALRARKALEARSAALEYFTSAKHSFQKKSKKQALRYLRAETGLPKYVLRHEIDRVMRNELPSQPLDIDQ